MKKPNTRHVPELDGGGSPVSKFSAEVSQRVFVSKTWIMTLKAELPLLCWWNRSESQWIQENTQLANLIWEVWYGYIQVKYELNINMTRPLMLAPTLYNSETQVLKW